MPDEITPSELISLADEPSGTLWSMRARAALRSAAKEIQNRRKLSPSDIPVLITWRGNEMRWRWTR